MHSRAVIDAIIRVQSYVLNVSQSFSYDKILIQCEPILGRGFRLGKYKCRCRPGYEYPFIDQNDFFTGEAMDAQWDLLMSSNSHMSRFDQLKCRIAMGSALQPTNLLLVTLLLSVLPG
jgi:phosphoribulokinase